MSTEHLGPSDPHRGMALLWRTPQPRKRGPKPRLTVEAIVQAAIELADAEGLPALSMRRVAEALGVTAMSLYTYVPGKAELVDVMLDTVYGEVPLPDGAPPPDDAPDGWRVRLASIARETWALYRRHPWMLQMVTTRPVLGPNVIAKYEAELRAVEGIGLSDLEMDGIVVLVADYVHGAARGAVDWAQAEQRTGLSDTAWWASYEPILEQVFDARRFPLAARVGRVAGEIHEEPYNPEFAFSFGLERVLDGIEALIRARQAG